MAEASGFEWTKRKNGDVVVTHHHKVATVLRNRKADEFLDAIAGSDGQEAQELMARLTGNYKRGNERAARQHPRQQRRSR